MPFITVILKGISNNQNHIGNESEFGQMDVATHIGPGSSEEGSVSCVSLLTSSPCSFPPETLTFVGWEVRIAVRAITGVVCRGPERVGAKIFCWYLCIGRVHPWNVEEVASPGVGRLLSQNLGCIRQFRSAFKKQNAKLIIITVAVNIYQVRTIS